MLSKYNSVHGIMAASVFSKIKFQFISCFLVDTSFTKDLTSAIKGVVVLLSSSRSLNNFEQIPYKVWRSWESLNRSFFNPFVSSLMRPTENGVF